MCLCSGPRPDAVCSINCYDMLCYAQSVPDLGPMQGTRSQSVPGFGPMQSVPDFGPMQSVPDFGPMQGTRSQSVPDFGPMQFSGSRPDAVGKAQYVFICCCMVCGKLGELTKLRAYSFSFGFRYFRKQREELWMTASHTPPPQL